MVKCYYSRSVAVFFIIFVYIYIYLYPHTPEKWPVKAGDKAGSLRVILSASLSIVINGSQKTAEGSRRIMCMVSTRPNPNRSWQFSSAVILILFLGFVICRFYNTVYILCTNFLQRNYTRLISFCTNWSWEYHKY